MKDELFQFIHTFLQKHEGLSFDIMEFIVDTSVSKIPSSNGGLRGIVPFLNVVLGNIFEGDDLDEAIAKAKTHEDMGFYHDIIDVTDESHFEFELSRVKPEWRDGTAIDDGGLVALLQEAVAHENAVKIKTILFHWVDSFDLVYL